MGYVVAVAVPGDVVPVGDPVVPVGVSVVSVGGSVASVSSPPSGTVTSTTNCDVLESNDADHGGRSATWTVNESGIRDTSAVISK